MYTYTIDECIMACFRVGSKEPRPSLSGAGVCLSRISWGELRCERSDCVTVAEGTTVTPAPLATVAAPVISKYVCDVHPTVTAVLDVAVKFCRTNIQ